MTAVTGVISRFLSFGGSSGEAGLPDWQKQLLVLLGKQEFQVFLEEFEKLNKAIPYQQRKSFEDAISRIVFLIGEKRERALASLKKNLSVTPEDVKSLREALQSVQMMLCDIQVTQRVKLDALFTPIKDTLGMLGDPLFFSQSIEDRWPEVVSYFPGVRVSSIATLTRIGRTRWEDNEGRIVGGGGIFQTAGSVSRAPKWTPIPKEALDCPLEWEMILYIPHQDRLGVRLCMTVPANPQDENELQELFSYADGLFKAVDIERYQRDQQNPYVKILRSFCQAINDSMCLMAALLGDLKNEKIPTAREQFAFLYNLYLRAKTYLGEEKRTQLVKLITDYFLSTAQDLNKFDDSERDLVPLLFFLLGDVLYTALWERLKNKSTRTESEDAVLLKLTINPRESYPEELFRLWRKHHEALLPLVKEIMGESELNRYLMRRLQVLRVEGDVAASNAAFFWEFFSLVPEEGRATIKISDSFGLLPWYERIGRLGSLADEECKSLDRALEDLNKRELVLWIVEASERLKQDKIQPLQVLLTHMTEGNQAVVRKFMEAELPSGKRTDFVRVFPTLAEMTEKGVSVDATPDAIQKFTNQEFQQALQWVAEGMKDDTDPTTIGWYVERIMAYNSADFLAIQKSNQLMEMIMRLNRLGKLEKKDHLSLYERLPNEKTWNGIRRFLADCEKTQALWKEYDVNASSERWMASFIEFIRHPALEGAFSLDDFHIVEMEPAPSDLEGDNL